MMDKGRQQCTKEKTEENREERDAINGEGGGKRKKKKGWNQRRIRRIKTYCKGEKKPKKRRKEEESVTVK